MLVGPVEVDHADGSSTITGTVTVDDASHVVWFRVPGDLSGDPRVVDAFVTLSVVHAMRYADEMVVAQPVSPRLLAALDEVQDIYTTWYPDELHRVKVVATARSASEEPDRVEGTASCFSGGVDSFHTLLRHRGKIEHLMFAEGYDVPLTHTAVLGRLVDTTERVAREVSARPLVVASNLKKFALAGGKWGEMMHGPALAAAAQLSSLNTFDRLYVPSGATYAALRPWGSHPMLDHLWGTEYLDIVHDGAAQHRIEKLAEIASHQVVRDHLRVCLRSSAGYNCGTCYKCVRTMTSLDLLDVLPQFTTLPDELDLDLVRRQIPRGATDVRYAERHLALAAAIPGKEALADALAAVLEEYENPPTPEDLAAPTPTPPRFTEMTAQWRELTGRLLRHAGRAARHRVRRARRALHRR